MECMGHQDQFKQVYCENRSNANYVGKLKSNFATPFLATQRRLHNQLFKCDLNLPELSLNFI